MTLLSTRMAAVATAALVAWLAAAAEPALAQCTSCATATTAYAPVVAAAPTVTYEPYTGWYPGRFFDRLRMRRWGVSATPAPTYTVGYAPSVLAAPAPVAYTTAYAPYVTAYAPLQRPVVQTTYLPTTTVDACTGCAQTTYSAVTTTSYAPSTLYRPAVLSPVAAAPACADCSTGAAYVDQAIYAQPAGCSSCESAAGGLYYQDAPAAAPLPGGSMIPTPELDPSIPVPSTSGYPSTGNGAAVDPGPTDVETKSSTSLDFSAPPLTPPLNDRTANRPSVDVQPALYRGPATAPRMNTAAAKPVVDSRTQVEIDAQGWGATSSQ